jgi:hypothetical protein
MSTFAKLSSIESIKLGFVLHKDVLFHFKEMLSLQNVKLMKCQFNEMKCAGGVFLDPFKRLKHFVGSQIFDDFSVDLSLGVRTHNTSFST